MSDFEKFIERCKNGNVIPVVDTMSADLLTPLAVYLRLSEGASHSFLLESVEGGETLARYSFIGCDPIATVTGRSRSVDVSSNGKNEVRPMSVIDFLRDHFAGYNVPPSAELPSFVGGAIGYFGYSAARLFEPKLDEAASDEEEIAEFMLFRSIVAFDHAKQVVKLVTLVFTEEASDGDQLETLYNDAVNANRTLRKRLEATQFTIPSNGSGPIGQVTSNWKRDEFEDAVVQIKELISAGECYQVVISQCFSKQTNASPVAIYRAVRSLNPSPYMFLLKLDGRSVIGASPEMLVRCRDHKLEYRPIAGTRPRGTDVADDDRLAEEMMNDAKEVAEHQMLVDLGRNDLGRVSRFGSVRVESLMNVEKYSHVQHLVSSLTSELADGKDRFDALMACFPAGTVSGAPKVRAMEVIKDLEPTPRGVYSGAVGYFDYSGNMDTCIAIRTMVLEDGVAKIQAGAGIVADSVPSAEFEETVNKAAALLKAVELAERTNL